MAMEYIDSPAVALDPELIEIEQRRATHAARREAEKQAKREAERLAAARAHKAQRSEAAFRRLLDSRDGQWAERWNAFAQSCDQAFLEHARSDAEFRRLHETVIDAETMPAKRKAIRAFLAYAESLRERLAS